MPEDQPTTNSGPQDEVDALELARQEAAEHHDKYLRALAESENMRKRLERLCDDRVWQEKKRLLTALLEFHDNLKEALKYAAGDDPVTKGVQAVDRHVQSLLDREGLQSVAAVGQPFNPDFHEAVELIQDPDRPNQVTLEYRTGYTVGGRLLRPARVQVNKAE